MKQAIIMLLVAMLGLTSANAQQTERIKRPFLYMTDSLRLDSMYNYWNDYVTGHPKGPLCYL